MIDDRSKYYSLCLKIEIFAVQFHTYPNGAKYLVHPLLLLVKEDRAPEADDQVCVLLKERHLVLVD